MADIAKELRAIRQRTGLSMAGFAKKLGYAGASSYQRYEKAENYNPDDLLPQDLGFKIIKHLAKKRVGTPPILEAEIFKLMGLPIQAGAGSVSHLGNTSDLPPDTSSDDPEDAEIVRVPGYDLRLSAGHGAIISNEEKPTFYQPFLLDWLRRITVAATSQLALVIVAGDSMSPTLENGDQALVDRTQNVPKDGVYALRIFGDELVVKRLTVQPFGRHLLTISSDNPKHKTYEGIDPDEVQVIGRVIWVGRMV